jgi:hypothetical protein
MRQAWWFLLDRGLREVNMNKVFLALVMGVDGIMTDDPPLLTSIIDELGAGD